MCQCSFENCNNKCFEEENKCILHCDESILIEYLEKNINDNDVLILNEIDFPDTFRYKIIFDKSKKIEFWNCIFNNIDEKININDSKKIHFYECKFEKQWCHFNIIDICYSDCSFYDEIIFNRDLNNGINKIYTIVMQNCNIYKNFYLDYSAENVEECEIDYLDFKDSIFHKKVEIKQCNIKRHSFANTRFKVLADFYKTEFFSNDFYKTTFEDISVFREAVFHKEVNFQFTSFNRLALFRKTIFEDMLNLEDSIIKEEANFLDITSKENERVDINVKNRETARIIKHSFEKQDNIIEANKFYAIEMKEREIELNKDVKKGKNFFEWLIFKAHGIASNHSQDWILALLWILYFSLSYFIFTSRNFTNDLLLATSIIFIISFLYSNRLLKIVLSIALAMMYLFFDINLDCMADKINPFSIMTSKDPKTFGLLIFKITIAYLIYQFIVSVRQNTRRK